LHTMLRQIFFAKPPRVVFAPKASGKNHNNSRYNLRCFG
jgi:hypothetical protein